MISEDPVSGPSLLECRGLRKSYGYRQVLRGVDLTLCPGECVLLLGANGSGKSTLLRILAGLSRAEAGLCRWRGHALAEGMVSRRSRIGYLGHKPALHGGLTLVQHLELAARLHGMADPEPRIQGLLRRSGMHVAASRPLQECSRGQLQKGELCRVWLSDPRLLLLDEPEAHLDEEGLDFLGALLSRRRAAGQSVLLATHRRALAQPWAERALLLRDGTLSEACDAP